MVSAYMGACCLASTDPNTWQLLVAGCESFMILFMNKLMYGISIYNFIL